MAAAENLISLLVCVDMTHINVSFSHHIPYRIYIDYLPSYQKLKLLFAYTSAI